MTVSDGLATGEWRTGPGPVTGEQVTPHGPWAASPAANPNAEKDK